MNVKVSELVGGGYGAIWRDRHRFRVIKGSRGSKKSKTMALQRIARILEFPMCNYLCVRRYGNALKDSIYSDTVWAINRFHLSKYFKCTTSPLEITYIPTGQKILFRGLDEGTKVTSISVPHGYLNFCDIEEAYEISEQDFDKLSMSIRGELPKGYFKQITLMFNPWSANSWLKTRFFDNPDDDTFTATTTYVCNEWLGEDDVHTFENLRKNSPKRYRIEGLGEWGISEGLIYENWVEEDFDINEIKQRSNVRSAFGMDFGFVDENAFVCSLVDNDNKDIFIFDEWFATNVTNIQIAEHIKSMGYGSERVICDCAEPKSISELYNNGIRAEACRKGADSVRHGISQIQGFRIHVKPKCVNIIKELSNYAWAKDKDGKPTDKPEHEFSHGMDALRYGVQKVLVGSSFSFD